ncbi:MAG: sigma-54 dependent transcriptional regulator [Steroidobacter sp.]
MSQSQGRILVVDDDDDVLAAARLLLRRHFSSVQTLNDPSKLPALVDQSSFDVLLLDMNFTIGADSGTEGLDCLSNVLEHDPQAVVVLLTAHSDVELAVEAMKKGAADFVSKPWENDRMVATLMAALNLRRSRLEAAELRERNRGLAIASHVGGNMIGNSPAMLKVFTAIGRAAPTEANILILGENGTGKELVAREIHRQSQRSGEVFLRVDMGAISPQLFESELFGHSRGAFTDAKQNRTGYFRAATAGTLFLDEIGNVPLYLQSKLLTALERREVVPVGTEKPESINVRLICATNLPPAQLGDESRFRQDLRYRINTVEIHLPALRERKEDIPLLLEHYIAFYCRKYNLPIKRVASSLIDRLAEWPWPGNVRELRHTIERAVVLGEGAILSVEDFPFVDEKAKTAVQIEDSTDISSLDSVEKAAIVRALELHKNNVSRAATALGLTRTSLYRRIEKYGL